MRRTVAALVPLVGALVAGCTGVTMTDPGPPRAAPPAPPAACLLDTATLAASTGLTWTPDISTASDTRCVYDPAGAAPGGVDFVAVDVDPLATTDVDAELESLAGACDGGSRAPVDAGNGAFVCRFPGGSIFAVLVDGGELVTVAVSAVPAGTTAARLVVALIAELSRLGG